MTGWWFQLPLWKIWKSDWIVIPTFGENKKCSEPTTRWGRHQNKQTNGEDDRSRRCANACGWHGCGLVQHGAAWCSMVQHGAAWCSKGTTGSMIPFFIRTPGFEHRASPCTKSYQIHWWIIMLRIQIFILRVFWSIVTIVCHSGMQKLPWYAPFSDIYIYNIYVMSDTGFIMMNIPSLYDYTYNIVNQVHPAFDHDEHFRKSSEELCYSCHPS